MSNRSVELTDRSGTAHDPTLDDRVDPALDATLAPVLGARKDGREHADSAGALLLTLLGELVRPGGGTAWTQSLIEALGPLGVSPKAARQAISRLKERNWLTNERSGRRTRWRFTPALSRLLDEGAQRIYRFGAAERAWDGRWLVVLASIPERQRQLRYRMTVGLTWAGFGSVAPGVWISPWVDRETEARRVIGTLDVEGATSFRAELGSIGNPHDMVARSWDMASVRDHYRRFLEELDQLDPTDPTSTTRDLILLVHRWRRFPFLDPGLPRELLPEDWPASSAAARFHERHEQWHPIAADWWRQTEDRFST